MLTGIYKVLFTIVFPTLNMTILNVLPLAKLPKSFNLAFTETLSLPLMA